MAHGRLPVLEHLSIDFGHFRRDVRHGPAGKNVRRQPPQLRPIERGIAHRGRPGPAVVERQKPAVDAVADPLGDAWYPIGSNPAFPLDSLARFRAAVEKLRKLASEAGRDPKSIGLAFRFPKYGTSLPDKAGDGERRLFSGSAAAIADDIKALAKIGVSAIDLSFGGATAADMLAEMKRFKSEVMARL